MWTKNKAEHPSSSGADSRTTKREPREVSDEQMGATEQHAPRRIEHSVAVVTQEAHEGCERREQRIELGINLVSKISRRIALRLQREVGT